jgi:thioredoxin-dependent peroxiredoxin
VLKAGDTAPDFEAGTSDGRRVRLSDLRGRPVVLYFFPKAFTPNCTTETIRFRDNYPELRRLGAEVLGVSTDGLDTQCRFATRHQVAFPLIGDEDRRICRNYGVLWALIPVAKRVTFVIDEAGVIERVLHHEFQVSKHLDGVVQQLERRVCVKPPGSGSR